MDFFNNSSGGGGGGSVAWADVTGKPAFGTVSLLSYPGGTATFLRADGTWAAPVGGSGDVVGPASAVNNQIAVFDLTTGKLIKDGGTTIAALSTATSSVASGVTSLSTSASTGLSTGVSGLASLSTVVSTTNSSVASLSTSASTGLSTGASGLTSLSTVVSTTNSSLTSLSTSASTGLSTGVSGLSSLSTVVSGVLLRSALNPPGGTTLFHRADDTWAAPPGGGGAAWGSITGTLASQTDLSTALSTGTSATTSLSTSTSTGLSTATSSITSLSTSTSTGLSTSVSGIASLSTAKANLASPPLTGTPTTPTAAPGTNNTQIASTAYADAAANLKITGPGTVTSGRTVVFSGTTGLVVAQSTRLEADLVAGPGSSVSGNLPTFNGTGGKTIQDGGVALSALATLASPALTGNPTAPTATVGDNDTSIATTAFVQGERAPRNQTTASTATLTPVGTAALPDDICTVTALAVAMQIANPSGTSAQGQGLVVRIKDNGTARALTYGSEFRAMGTPLPTTTVINKTMYLGFIRNTTDTKWDLVSVAQEA